MRRCGFFYKVSDNGNNSLFKQMKLWRLQSPWFPNRFLSGAVSRMSQGSPPIESSIRHKLSTELNASHLEIINESYMHNVPKGAETHFKVVVVSDRFTDLTLIKRHRLVNNILKDELQNGVHALSIIAKTPQQWSSDYKVEPSPNCKGGFGK